MQMDSETERAPSKNWKKYPTKSRFILLPSSSMDFLLDKRLAWSRDQLALVLLVSNSAEKSNSHPDVTKNLKNILQKIWNKYGVNNIFIGLRNPQKKNNNKIWTFDPFSFNKITKIYGKLKQIAIGKKNSSRFFKNKPPLKNLQGYRLNIGLFDSPPSAPKFKGWSKYESIEDFHGVDGLVLATLVKKLNFTVNIVPPSNGIEYGYITDNGTFFGTIGLYFFFSIEKKKNILI